MIFIQCTHYEQYFFNNEFGLVTSIRNKISHISQKR